MLYIVDQLHYVKSFCGGIITGLWEKTKAEHQLMTVINEILIKAL